MKRRLWTAAIFALLSLHPAVGIAGTGKILGWEVNGRYYKTEMEACQAAARYFSAEGKGVFTGKTKRYGEDTITCEVKDSDGSVGEPQVMRIWGPEDENERKAQAIAEGTRKPADCGLSAEQRAALKTLLGQTFDTVPQLKAAWEKSVDAETLAAVRKLKPDPSTNQTNRAKYFPSPRKNFWNNLKRYADGADGISEEQEQFRELLKTAGITIPGGGASGKLLINGVSTTLDVDHKDPLYKNPEKMLDASNLRLSPAKENQYLLRMIESRDPFQDPERYLAAMEKHALAQGCQLKKRR